MITDRLFDKETDMNLLELSLSQDEHHTTTKPEFFFEKGTVLKIYEDEKSPILIVRGAKTLRLDIQFVSNTDTERNKKAMLEGFDGLAAQALANGFTEIAFQSDSKLLRRFCKQNFGFVESNGELRKQLTNG